MRKDLSQLIDIRHVQELVSRIQYKSNFKFYAGHSPYDDLYYMTIVAMVKDVGDPKKEIPIQMRLNLQSHIVMDEELFKHFVLTALIDFEKHECTEWLKYDGRQIVDPHPVSQTA
jgi:hypothetical protein